jgi:hypothetical protein
MSETPPPRYKLLRAILLITLVLGMLICGLAKIGPVEPVSIKILEIENPKTVTLTSLPSSVIKVPYKVYTNTFENYCPLCGATGNLRAGIKRQDEITCLSCDADYCVWGYDKTSKPRGYLIQTNKTKEIIEIDGKGI